MATYRELTYMVLDELKLVSDDSHFQKEHVIFLLDKYRAFLLKQRYSDVRKEIPESNYQTICVDLVQTEAISGEPCAGGTYLKSVQTVPNMMQIGKQKVSAIDYFLGNFTYVNNERFKYVGFNKYLKNQAYSTIAPDHHLYMKSNNPQLYYLNKVKITGMFENGSEAAQLQCDSEEPICDILDKTFPIEEPLIPPMIELIVKELSGKSYQPTDSENNAADDLSKLASYLARNLKKRTDDV